MLHNIYRDVVLGLRSLRKNPILSLTAVLTLALGIGANTAIFTLLYGLVLRSLPTPQAWQLAKVTVASAAEPDSEQESSFVPYRMMQGYQAAQTSFRELSAWSGEDILMKDATGAIRNYYGVLVSGNAFDLMRIPPYRGRLIAPYDDVKGGPRTGWPVVLSYGYWSERFGRSNDAIGSSLEMLDRDSHKQITATIVGVTPPDFRGVWPGEEPKLYLPLQMEDAITGKRTLDDPESAWGVATIG